MPFMLRAIDSPDTFLVSSEEASLRLDKLLALHFPSYSRTYFHYLLEQGCVLVNGKQLKKRDKPLAGDEIEVCFLLTPESDVKPEAIPLDILYEDEDLLVINKPAGMVVHPAPGHFQGTFVNALLHHCQSIQGMDPLRPGIVHRLDKDTTGALIAAKNPQAHAKLVALFAARKITKKYLAICVGTPQEGIIEAPIKRDPIHRKQMAICPLEGKEAKTGVRVLAKNEQLSYVELDLMTGRTHQIRVHMKHVNTPILGDPVYGFPNVNKKFNLNRQMLHAAYISFPHPSSAKQMEFHVPAPSDLNKVLDTILVHNSTSSYNKPKF